MRKEKKSRLPVKYLEKVPQKIWTKNFKHCGSWIIYSSLNVSGHAMLNQKGYFKNIFYLLFQFYKRNLNFIDA